MKKSSILVTLFLVVALVFAVSCPDNSPALKVTSPTGTAAAVSATVGQEKDIAIKLELANDAFVATTVKTNADLKDWFTLSDGTTTAKASVVSALVSKVSAAESTTKADGDAKLVIAELTLKVSPTQATEASKPVTVAIKVPAEKDNVKYTESGKEITAAANDIRITITDAARTDVEATVGGDTAEFTAGTADTTKNVTVTLNGGTFANITGISVKKGDADPANFDISYAIGTEEAKKNELTITLKSKASIAAADQGTYKINIPASAITADDTHVAKAISKDLTVTVTAAPAKTPATASITSDSSLEFTQTIGEDKDVTIKLSGAKVKSGVTAGTTVTYMPSVYAVTAKIKTAEVGTDTITITFTSGSDTAVVDRVTSNIILTPYVEAADDSFRLPDQLYAEISIKVKSNV